MAYYVDVILPIAVNQKFTYIISKDEYDFIVMNDDFETCVKRIESIIQDERKKN